MRSLRRGPALLTAGLVAALAVTHPLAADAARLVTGADVKDESLTTKDVKNRSLTARDFAVGSLPAGPRGPVGPRGLTGPEGSPGPIGASGAQGAAGGGGVNIVSVAGVPTEPTLPAYVQVRFIGPTALVSVVAQGTVAGSAMAPMFGNGPIQLDWCYRALSDNLPTSFSTTPAQVGLDSASTSQAIAASVTLATAGTYEVGPCYLANPAATYQAFGLTGFALTSSPT